MSFTALHALKIGCVKYLNSEPLIHAYDGEVTFGHPSDLAKQLESGELDVALVPVFHALSHPGYRLVDGVGICCDGPVYSVVLTHQCPLDEIRSISLDPASLSSAHLVRVILKEFYDITPEITTGSSDSELLIGNQAIEARHSLPANRHVLDLGEEWKARTGLPFVFALWAMRESVNKNVAHAFRELSCLGRQAIPQIVAGKNFMTREFRTRYLTRHIQFQLGEAEKAGIKRYRELLQKHGLLPEDNWELGWV